MENEKNEYDEVRSKKIGRFGRFYWLRVRKKDLPEGVKKEDLIAAYKVAAKQGKEKNTKSFRKKALVPILLPLVLIGAVKGCASKDVKDAKMDVQTTQKIVEQINSEIYNVDSPYVSMESLVNAKGQEGMTANAIDGDIVLDGKYYDCDKQYSLETQASSGHAEFEQMKDEMNNNMEILTSADASQSEKAEAAKKALDINKKIQTIYKDNLEFVEKQSKDFEKSSKAFKDSNTDAEIQVIEATVNEYKNNLNLTDENVANLYQFVELNDAGYSINIDAEVNSRGDYQIAGEAEKEVINKQTDEDKNVIQKDSSNTYHITSNQVKELSEQFGKLNVEQFEEFQKYVKSPTIQSRGGEINER